MAKIAICGYGHDGRGTGPYGDGYAYLVNDNVNKGDVLQVIATSRKGNKFATTAQSLETHRENSIEGSMAKTMAESNMASQRINKAVESGKGVIGADLTDIGLTKVYSGKELGVKGFRGGAGYQEQTRANALQQYAQEHPNATFSANAESLMEKGTYQTFDEYSKPFMGGNK